jgi:hypothetical protein
VRRLTSLALTATEWRVPSSTTTRVAQQRYSYAVIGQSALTPSSARPRGQKLHSLLRQRYVPGRGAEVH